MEFRRILCFHAKGTRLSEFINAVRCSDIVCISQRCSFGEYSGRIYYSDFEYLSRMAENYRIDIYFDEYNKGIFKVFRYRTRYGIIAGIIIAAAFIFFMSSTVVRIEINGNSEISDIQILNVLKDTGVKHGAFIPFLDLSESELAIRSEISNITWAAIRNRGGRIIVDVKEAEGRNGSVHSNIPCNVVSLRDAQIVSVSPHRGMSVIKPGDAVGAGDILISGVETNEMNNYVVMHAEGEITGDYEETQKFIRYFDSTCKEYTGNVRKNWFYFFGFRMPLFIGGKCDFQADYSERTDYFTVGDYELPLGIVSAEYKIYDFIDKRETDEGARADLENQMNMYERNFYSNCEILSREKKEKIYEDRMEYEVRYIIRGEIGTEKVFFPGKEESSKADIIND